jgi:hypothetical protein
MPQWAYDLAALEIVVGVIAAGVAVIVGLGACVYWRWRVWNNARLLQKELREFVGKRFVRTTPQEWWTREGEVVYADGLCVTLEITPNEQRRLALCCRDNLVMHASEENWVKCIMDRQSFMHEWREIE